MELKELNNLGVLAGPDMGLLLNQLPDPTAINSWVKKAASGVLGTGDPIMAKFNTFQRNLKTKLGTKMSSYGFRKISKKKAEKQSILNKYGH